MRNRLPDIQVGLRMGQVLTASRLGDGAVVFMDATGGWGERLDGAHVYPDKAAAALGLALGQEAEKRNEVLDLYAIDVSTLGGAIVPLKLRETIRARGPTIHPEFTKAGSTPRVAQEDDHVSV